MGIMHKFYLWILGIPFVIFFGMSVLSSFTGKSSDSDKNIQITCIKKDCEQDK